MALNPVSSTATYRQIAVTACLISEQLVMFAFDQINKFNITVDI